MQGNQGMQQLPSIGLLKTPLFSCAMRTDTTVSAGLLWCDVARLLTLSHKLPEAGLHWPLFYSALAEGNSHTLYFLCLQCLNCRRSATMVVDLRDFCLVRSLCAVYVLTCTNMRRYIYAETDCFGKKKSCLIWSR